MKETVKKRLLKALVVNSWCLPVVVIDFMNSLPVVALRSVCDGCRSSSCILASLVQANRQAL